MISIHDLRDRVLLLKRRIVEKEDGSFTESWQEGDLIWAKVLPYVGSETIGEGWNMKAPVQSRYKVIFRFRRGRFARIKWEGMTLGLLCLPLIDQRRQWITCFMYAVGENDE